MKNTKQNKQIIAKNVLTEDKLRDRYVYNPDKKYYFLSVIYSREAPKWIRRPFLTEDEIREFLIEYSLSEPYTYSNLEIIDENFLREKIKVLSTAGDYVDIDMRYFIFDALYSTQSESYSGTLAGDHMTFKRSYSDWKANNEIEA